jgi:hypothetical protein
MTIANSGRLIAHYDLMSRLWDTDDAETCDAIERERQALPQSRRTNTDCYSCL